MKAPKKLHTFTIALAYDALACAVAWFLAYQIRFNFEIPKDHWSYAKEACFFVVMTQSWLLWANGVYRIIWRYFSLPDLGRIGASVGIAIPFNLAVLFFINHLVDVPRMVWPLNAALVVLFIGGARLGIRLFFERKFRSFATRSATPVLVMGAGEACLALLKELSHTSQWSAVGLLDDDPALHGRVLYGVRVYGPFEQLPELVQKFGVKHAIIAIPSATPAQRRRAVEICKNSEISTFTVPSWSDLLSGKVTMSNIRQVELEDLLGRGPVVLDNAGLIELLSDQVVMVTGAGGSIGSELCRKIAQFKPKLIILYELNEPALYQAEQEFTQSGFKIASVIGDVKNEARLNWVMKKYHPTVVFHAAAYKHVPLMEVENTWEAVQNNVGGTYMLAKMAIANNVQKFVYVSSDKAVNPTNVMGATKRLSEMVCQSLQSQSKMKFVIVRFGNVLGSAGSVIPKFREQIAKGGPITVTHPEIKRYFMSIPEAAQLVLQAALMGKGGEIFVLDMGTPIRIADLAKLMIKLSGFSEDDIKISFVGLRPGEKLFEELLGEGEIALATHHPKVRIARSAPVDEIWMRYCSEWLSERTICSDDEMKRAIQKLLPEYKPTEQAKLDSPSSKEKRKTN